MTRLCVFREDAQPTLWLPPKDVRLWDIGIQGRIETPLDDLGMVDLDRLVEVGRQSVDSSFSWESPFNDVHHLQWHAAMYPADEDPLGHEFRELARRKALIPRKFHNWLHILTTVPPKPSPEVMRSAVDAEKAARDLAKTAQRAVKLTRIKGIPEGKLSLRLEQEYENYMVYIENARLVPEEFQLLELAKVEARNVEETLTANKHLGKLALHRTHVRLRSLQAA
jgi:hypothetical protein